MSRTAFAFSLLFASLSFACGGSGDDGASDDVGALVGPGAQTEQAQSNKFEFSGDFVRSDCQASGTHSPTQCGGQGNVGRGSFTVELLDAVPAVSRSTENEKMRAKITVKAPGILAGDAPIDVSFETELKASSWGVMYNANYDVTGKRFEGASPRETFPNNPVFDKSRSVGISADVMATGKITKLSVRLTFTHDLDNSTSIGFDAVP